MVAQGMQGLLLKGVLQVLHEGEIVDTIVLKRETTTFGRDEGDIVLEDPEVSSTHSQILFVGNQFVITDLNSTNGTFVNGQRVVRMALNHGDKIKIGNVELLFSLLRGQEPAVRDTVNNPQSPVAALDDKAQEILRLVRAERENALAELVLELQVTYGDMARETLLVADKTFTAGRLSTAGKFDKDDELSRRHARIQVTADGRVEVTDLESTNGTFVNEEQITLTTVVAPGDVVRIGKTRFRARAVLPY